MSSRIFRQHNFNTTHRCCTYINWPCSSWEGHCYIKKTHCQLKWVDLSRHNRIQTECTYPENRTLIDDVTSP